MLSEMQERVARAIYEGRNGHGCIPWSRRDRAHKAPYLSDALAAMKAMLEPTDGMHDAARDWSIDKYGKAIGSDASDGCYRAMLSHEIAAAEEPHNDQD